MYQTRADTTQWEPFGYEGATLGQVHWITKGISGLFLLSEDEETHDLPYEYTVDCTIHVLTGSMRFTFENGHTFTVRAGDIAVIPRNAPFRWSCDDLPFREVFFYS